MRGKDKLKLMKKYSNSGILENEDEDKPARKSFRTLKNDRKWQKTSYFKTFLKKT